MKLYDNPFSPFARKVWMALRWKGLPFEAIDALAPERRTELAAVNARVEVPVLEDGDLRIVNSADIVAYLDHRYPERPLLPADPAKRVAARALERLADTALDAIYHDISIWTWPFLTRHDGEVPGLRDAGRADLLEIYGALEAALGGGDYFCGELSIADIALFPHLVAARPLGVPFTPSDHPRLTAWFRRMRAQPICVEDAERSRDWLREAARSDFRTEHIVWRGDRIEWMLSRGFGDWFAEEVRSGRARWPRR